MNVQIAQRLAELRRSKGYSQEALANELGLSRQAVSKWERAESSPDTENLIALARLYGVSLDDLLRLDDDVREDAAFEKADREREQEGRREQQAAENRAAAAARTAAEEARAADREATAQVAAAAAQASDAAARAAQAAAQASERAVAAPVPGRRRRGPWSSFPYGWLTVLLFFVFGYWGRWSTAWLIFLTIPIYRWIAGILDEEHARRQALRDAAPDAGQGQSDVGAGPSVRDGACEHSFDAQAGVDVKQGEGGERHE